MAVTVKLNYLRIAPRKVRLAADLIRGKTVSEAEDLLKFMRKKAARALEKLLKSATATAGNDFKLERSNLYISKITVDEGPTLKRHRARGRGRIFSIFKRTSHIALTLNGIKPGKEIKRPKRVKKEIEIPKKEVRPREEREKVEMPKKRKPRPKVAIPKSKIKAVKRIFRRKAF